MLVRMRWMRSAVLVVLGACGPTTADDEGDSSESDASTSSTATTTTTASTTTTGVDAGSDSDGSTGAAQCDALLGEDGTHITMNVRNARATPIYLDMNGCGPVFSMTGPDADAPTPWLFPDCDMPSCDSLVSGDCSVACGGGGGACQLQVIRVQPGAVYSHSWSGSVFVEVTAPLECTPADCAPSCFQRIPAADGAYTIAANVFDDCPLVDPAACECEPIDGTCTVVADDVTVTPTEVSVGFAYPDEVAPEIVAR
jgi:hypothetical protein